MNNILLTILLISLAPILINGILIKVKNESMSSGIITSLSSFIILVITSVIFFSNDEIKIIENVGNWLYLDEYNLNVNFTLMCDHITIVFLFLVSIVSFFVSVFSIGYMKNDKNPGKYYTFLSLFIFFMLLLILAENMFVLFIGWEGVGLCSYLLIGFWHEKKKNINAAKKAFLINRLGDFGVLLGFIGLIFHSGSISFNDLNTGNDTYVFVSLLLILIGIFAKSAQLPLFVWLPDAMAGPTPASALIHAATMVTAGIFLLNRISPVLNEYPLLMDIVAMVGVVTSVVASLIALTQRDLKKILAYSTISQLGLMVMACGLGAYSSSIFHLVTHGFFKALLFLCAGSVIYLNHHEQDIFKIKLDRNENPILFYSFLIGLFSIIGIPGFASFFSKDEILWFALNNSNWSTVLFSLAYISVILTTLYMCRMFINIFYLNNEDHESQEEHPNSMKFSLLILTVLTVLVGFLGLPHIFTHVYDRGFQKFLELHIGSNTEVSLSQQTETLLLFTTLLGVFISVYATWYIYVKLKDKKINQKIYFKYVTLWSFFNKEFLINNFLNNVFYQPFIYISKLAEKLFEKLIIDGIVRGVPYIIISASNLLRTSYKGELDLSVFYIIAGTFGLMILIFSRF
jgi:NADH-quinone oxidoreductase subunit L